MQAALSRSSRLARPGLAAAAWAARRRPTTARRPSSSPATHATPGAQAEQQQEQPPALPSLTELLTEHGARLTTAAQMAWAQVLRPGDTAVDATCGNGNDALFIARRIGPAGTLHALDLQAAAVDATRQLLESNLAPAARPALAVQQGCHSQLQALVGGSNLARLVAFNLGYLPGGDKSVKTTPATTLAAVEAALEVVCPGGLVSLCCYIGHEGGLQEYEQVRELLAALPASYWTTSELRLLNRATAPILLLVWRRPDAQPGQQQAKRR